MHPEPLLPAAHADVSHCVVLQVPIDKEAYEAQKAADPEFYRSADSLLYGKAPELPKQNVDRMVAELADRCVCV